MSKMIDLGKKNDNTIGEVPISSEKNVVHYPSFSLYDTVPEEVFKKEVGATFEAKILCKLVSKGVDEDTKRKNKRVSLDIMKIGVENKEKDLEDEVKNQLDIEEK